jgi:7-keto-8-aminopelargonate synthetase-like enzyme
MKRRTHARVTLRGTAKVSTGDLVDQEYEVVNLSQGGVRLEGDLPLRDGEALDLSIELPGQHAPLDVHGVVRWSAPAHGGGAVMAVEFVDVSRDIDVQLTEAVTDAYKALGAQILGKVRADLTRQGVTDIRVVAETLQRVKEEQAQAHLFASDLYTEHGSDTEVSIVSGTTGIARDCVVWSLNLYLGLNRCDTVIEKTRAAVARFGTGSGTSAPSGGLSALHHEIETRVADMVGKEKAIVYSTGYAANLGALSALPGPKDLVILDREAHSSMLDGVKLSQKKWITFRHNDVQDLAEKLERVGPHHENIFVVVESAYSMSGDLAPLREIVALKQRHRFFLYVDEAHTFGFYGEGGKGYCQAQGVASEVDFIMSTFSKATAAIGGFVAADEKYCTVLQATSTPYIFQATLSPPDAATILASLDELQGNPRHAETLHANNRYMRGELRARGFDLGRSESPVIPVYVPDLEKLYTLCARLYLDGIFSVPVVFPAVGVEEGRIRFIVNATHTKAQIDRTVEALTKHAQALGVLPG